MDERVEAFRGRDRRGPCAGPLKAAAVSYARERVKVGESLERIARELQTKGVTLRRWLEEGPAPSPFRAVEVVPPLEVGAATERADWGTCGVLVTRQGHRVYDLEPAALAQILAALG